jgi:hypothetical protein
VLDESKRRAPDYVLTVAPPGNARASITGLCSGRSGPPQQATRLTGVDAMSDTLHVGRSPGYYWVNWSVESEPVLWDGVRWYFIGTADDAPDQPIVLSDMPIVFVPALKGAHGREADRGA